MIQAPLEVYRIDMKYIRNLHNIDARYVSGEEFSARAQCLDFKRMEIECKQFAKKKK